MKNLKRVLDEENVCEMDHEEIVKVCVQLAMDLDGAEMQIASLKKHLWNLANTP